MTTTYPSKSLGIEKKRTLNLPNIKILKTELILHLFKLPKLGQTLLNESILR